MASVLGLLGYRARVEAVNGFDAYFAKVSDPRARAQIGFGGWLADFPSAASFLPPLLSCAGFFNLSAFCNPAIDEQMARAALAQVQDPAAASALWQQVEQSLLAQAPLVPLYNPSNVDFVSKRVGNYQYNPQWGVLLDQLWVK